MTLAECFARVSFREFRIWLAWFDLQWSRPYRTDHYLMQIACEVTRSRVKYPRSVKHEHFQLQFTTVAEPTPISTQLSSSLMKAKWVAMMGMQVEEIILPATVKLGG